MENIFSLRTNVIHMKHRIYILDFYRGVGMLLVLLHHSGIPFGEYILAFHMPLFFILAGYTMYKKGSKDQYRLRSYVSNRFKRLIIPYFCFEVVNFILYLVNIVVRGGDVSLLSSLISITTCINVEGYAGICGRLWFLPCMFVADIYVFLGQKVISYLNCQKKNQNFFMVLLMMLLFFLSMISCRLIPVRLPFTLDTAFMAAAFILMGLSGGRILDWLINNCNVFIDISVLAVSIGLFLGIITQESTYMHMYLNDYGNYPLTVLCAIVGTIVFLVLGKYLYRLLKGFKFIMNGVLWYSYNSLVLFPVHLEIKWVILFVLTKLHISGWYLVFMGMLICSIPLVNFATRYMPFMSGKFSSR